MIAILHLKLTISLFISEHQTYTKLRLTYNFFYAFNPKLPLLTILIRIFNDALINDLQYDHQYF